MVKNFLPTGLKMNMQITLKLYQQVHQSVPRPAVAASAGMFLQIQILELLAYRIRTSQVGPYQSEF